MERKTDVNVVVTENYEEMSVVAAKVIAEQLKAQSGIEIDRRKIVMSDPIKAYGSYQFDVRLFTDVVGKLNVLICE